MDKQLIVIGNGFDLTAGLNSTYKAFFEHSFKGLLESERYSIPDTNSYIRNGITYSTESATKNIERDNITMIEYILYQENNFNFWFALFWNMSVDDSNENNYWSDVESIILNSLNNIEENYNSYNNNRLSYNIKKDPLRNAVGAKLTSMEYNVFGPQLKVTLYENKQYKKTILQISFLKEIFEDLVELEKKFIVFLEDQIGNEYIGNANKLISELIIKEYKDTLNYDIEDSGEYSRYQREKIEYIKNGNINTQILSFNYTHETKDENFVNAECFNNVHGNLVDKNIIFGVDGYNLNPKLYNYSKTYRIMSLNNEAFQLDSDITYIKFFGHGLAEADYSYFQTIFDSVDLYKSKTIVIFYYSIYDKAKKSEIEENQRSSVYRLINKYGETMDNKDHGKNMLHKLLLEGRLKVEELNTNFIQKK